MASSIETAAITNLSFMQTIASTTFLAAGAVLANMGILKAINTISGMALAGISAVQGLGVSANEEKEHIDEKDQIGSKLTERGFKIIIVEAKALPKIAIVTAIGITCMFVGLWTGGTSIESIIKSFSK